MRVALISLTSYAADEPGMPLAGLILAGRSLAERQLELALSLGCERIVCLSQGLDKALIALQHRAEGAGARFNIVPGARALAGLVNSADELVVIADGLLPLAPEALAVLEQGPGVLVLPVEAGIAAGFERIDLNHAWAGLLAMPGGLVERLNQLPPDCDTISALLRIALQGRVPERNLPEKVLAERNWALLSTHAALTEFEPEWFRRHVAPPSPFAPGQALARIAMRNVGARLLAKGWKPSALAGGGVILGALGVLVAWFGFAVPGILACGAGWLAVEAGGALTAISRAGAGSGDQPDRIMPAAGIAIDCAFVAILALALTGSLSERLYAPLVLLGTVRIAGALTGPKWTEFMQDRAIFALLLAAGAATHALLPAIELLSLALIAAIIGITRAFARITQA